MRRKFLAVLAAYIALSLLVDTASAQIPATPEQAAKSKLTSDQITYDKALVVCYQRINQEEVPALKRSDFLTQCLQAQGIADPPLTPPQATSPQ